jgi:Kef-type K+ transport system membrane component KefB
MLHPLSTFFVPLFFVHMGIKIELASLFSAQVIGLALALTAVAVIGKQACGLGVLEKGLDRFSIGLGMVPRGEVGLIFAGVGLTLKVHGQRVLDEAAFAAILFMVVVTTLITPPLLQWSFTRREKIG